MKSKTVIKELLIYSIFHLGKPLDDLIYKRVITDFLNKSAFPCSIGTCLSERVWERDIA